MDHPLLTHQAPQGHRQSRRQAVTRQARRQDALLVRLGLIAEETLARCTDDAYRNPLFGQQGCPLDQRRDLRTRSDEHGGRFGGVDHDIGPLGHLGGLLAAAPAQRRQGLDILARKHECHGPVLLQRQLPRHDGLVAVGRTQHKHRPLALVVAQVLQQADLRLLLDGLVRRTVLAHTERVVRPDVDHVQPHERRETHRGLHVVREDKEGAAGRDHAAVQRHAVHHAGHRQLRDARLEELARKVAPREGPGLLEVTVGLVRIGEVGRGDDHVLDLLGIESQHRGRGGARGNVGLQLDRLVVDLGQLTRKEAVELVCELLVLLTPRLLDARLLGRPGTKRLAALGEDLAALLEDGKRIVGITPEVADRRGKVGSGRRQRLSVRRDPVLVARPVGPHGPLAHHRAADDERRTLHLGLCGNERLADLVDVVSVDLQHVPAPRLVLHGHVLRINLVDLRRELDVVRIVVHHEVGKPQVSGDAAHALRDLLLDGTVRDVGIGAVRHPLAEARRQEALGNGCAEGHGMSLPQRAGGVLHAAQHVHLGVAGRHAPPLPQRLEVLGRIESGQRQHRIEHRRHVSRIEEEAVAVGIGHVVGVVAQELRVEHRDEIGAAHRSAGMTRLRLFDHGGRQDADVVGNAR